MPDNLPPPAPSPNPTAATPSAKPGSDFRIGEEFGTAKKNLPPVKIVAIGVVVILIGWGIAAFIQRPRSSAAGSIDEIASVETPGQNEVMAAINVSFTNNGQKPFYIQTIKAEVETANGVFSGDAAPAVDLNRYYLAFPALKQYATTPLQREAKIEAGGQAKGTIVVGIPVTPDAFASRKSLKVIIQPYDQPVPLVLTK